MSLVNSVSELLAAKPFCKNGKRWRNVVDESFRLGISLRNFADSLFRIASVSDQLVLDAINLKRRVAFRGAVIAGLALLARLMLHTVSPYSKQGLVLDLGFVVLVSILALFLVRQFFISIPRVWSWDFENSTSSQPFIYFCEAMILDRGYSQLNSIFGPDFHDQMKQLFRAESVDGICRQEERRYLAEDRALVEGRKVSERIHKISMFTPFLELILFSLLAVGICGIPLVDFLSSDATIQSYDSKDTEDFYDPFE